MAVPPVPKTQAAAVDLMMTDCPNGLAKYPIKKSINTQGIINNEKAMDAILSEPKPARLLLTKLALMAYNRVARITSNT